MVKARFTILAALLIACWQGSAGAAELNATLDPIFDTLGHGHPRLMLKVDAVRDLKEQAKEDEQSPPQKRNKGVSRLVIRLPESQESLTIAVLLSPEWKDGV